jgi:RNA polymerase sigma factor (sigma-70 family)
MSSSILAASVRRLRGRLAVQRDNHESDDRLLHAFTAHRDEAAFAVLVHRHGPMVLHVCRRVLGHQQDAEDAFQATFLVLAQNAAVLRNKTALASWLHGTAYRIAMKAKQSAIRRRKHEGQAPPRPLINPIDELSWREVRSLLDEEIARLPEIYRSAFILYHLEHLSRSETAQCLGLKDCTVLSRLAEARKRLSLRLARRGVELTAVLAAAALAAETASALPAGLMATTIKAALATAAGENLAGIVSASVVELVNGATAALIGSKAKIATVLMLTATLLAGAGAWACGTLAMPQPAETPAPPHPAQAQKPATSREEKSESVTVGGQVLGPDGKPVRGARVYLPNLKSKQLRALATSDAAGRFRFQVRPADVWLTQFLREPWRGVYVVAVAEGYGPAIAAVGDPAKADKLTLRLAKDDVAIKGRVLDLQGKPVAGVAVRVDGIGVPKKGDLTAFLEDLKGRSGGLDAEFNFLTTVEFSHFCPPVTTGTDGRFQINGIGGERLAHLTIDVDPGRTLNGRIVGPDDKPLAGARICGLQSYRDYWESEPLRTAEFTVYALTPGQPRNLLVIHEGKRLAGSLVVRGDEKEPVTIKLQPSGTLTGRLVTADGKPYTKGELRFALGQRADDKTVGSHPLHTIPRDKKGRFRVEGLVPGLKYHLILLPGGRVGKEITAQAGKTVDLGEVTVKQNE